MARESALLFGLYALWQFAGSFTVMSTAGAMPRARWLWHAERVLLLPSETSLQRPFLAHPALVQAFNLYYDILHFPVLGACLIWLYARHRESYPPVRTTVALFTGLSLLIQLIPVAPPRLLPGTGLVDTAVRYGQSVYSWHGGFDADEFSAMPSVHVGWALIVAIAVITVSRSRWRWLAAAYPAAHAARRRGDSQSLLAGRNRGRAARGPGAGGAATARAANYALLRLLPHRPAWDHCVNGDRAGIGGSHGGNGSAAGRAWAAARRDRPA